MHAHTHTNTHTQTHTHTHTKNTHTQNTHTLKHTHTQEKSALLDRRTFLKLASTGCDRFDLNRSAWALESEPKQIGGLIYW